jgi:hypothetical protein
MENENIDKWKPDSTETGFEFETILRSRSAVALPLILCVTTALTQPCHTANGSRSGLRLPSKKEHSGAHSCTRWSYYSARLRTAG